MTQCANSHNHSGYPVDGDNTRRRAYEEAMARFAGRRGIGRSVAREDRATILEYEDHVIAGVAS